MQLNVTLSARNLAKFRTLLKAQPMLAAKALTFTAERAVTAWRAGHSVFHRRNTFIDKGVRMRAATPGNLNAAVGTIDKFMGRHVKGVDEPKRGRLFVPLYDDVAEVPTHTRVRNRLRQADRSKRKLFWFERNGAKYLARRTTKKSTPLQVLGTLREGAQITPRLDAFGIVDQAVQVNFPTVYRRLLDKWASEQG